MTRPHGWVFNLDAEEELAAGEGYRRVQAMSKLLPPLQRRAAQALMARGDVWVTENEAPPGCVGRAWCPTPSALEALRAAGLTPEPAPTFDVLRRVNDRAFVYEVMGPRLDGARVFGPGFALDVATRHTHALIDAGGAWLKRPYGAAGRAKRRFTRFDAEVERYLIACQPGGVVLEPHVEVLQEVSLHAVLDEDVSAPPRIGRVCELTVRGGRFVGARVAPDGVVQRVEVAALTSALRELATSLRAEGYFGPMGIDAYRYRDHEGAVRFNPVGELNARYTMATRLGMG